MSLYRYMSKEAIENFTNNKFAKWYKANADLSENGGSLAFQRLKEDFLNLGSFPSGLNVDKEDNIFTIGSCFARGIEAMFRVRGFSVLSAANEFDDFELARPGVTGLGFTNKYNTFSILNEIRWALDDTSEFPTNSIVHVGDEMYVDPHVNPTLKLVKYAETMERRKIIRSVNMKIKDCRIVVVTLGLVEVWYDEEESVYLNATPTNEMQKLYPDRYSFHVTNYHENMNNLEEIYDLLNKHGHKELKVVVTVSPIPLMATFSERDVVLANTYSKSLLRVVAEEWSSKHENVVYFPSYEVVMNSNIELVWEEDRRHVKRPVVDHIMNAFYNEYVAQ